MDGGYQAVQDLVLSEHPITALFITNFEMTLGGMLALQHLNIQVPEDLSVIGFDKLEMFGNIFPHLTLIHQPQVSIGQECAKLMLDMLSGESSPRTVSLSTQLSHGNSVRPVHG